MRIRTVGNALSLFLAVTFTLCVLWGLLVPPRFHMMDAWTPLLPGFEWISLPSFLLGLGESYLYGWYIALVYVPLYRFFDSPRTSA